MIICISGTPGTGKSHLARLLAKRTGFRYFDLNNFIKGEKLYDSYDKKDKTYDVDTKKLSKLLNMLLKKYRYEKNDKEQSSINKTFKKSASKRVDLLKFLSKISIKKKKKNNINNIIIDSHLSHYMESDYCIIVKSDLKVLAERLRKRGYNETKIKDNLESEIFDICLEEAKALNRRVIIVNN